MDKHRQESQLDFARRYAREGEERVGHLNRLIERTRVLGKPTDELERLLAEYRDWLHLARLYLHYQEAEANSVDRAKKPD